MQFHTHGLDNGLNDLYILPETPEETQDIRSVIDKHKGESWAMNTRWHRSDVEGQDWYGKQFLEIPFGESLRHLFDK